MIGNALPAQSWAITIDRTAPAVLSSLPANGAVDVPLDTTVLLQFSETLNPASVTSANIGLYDDLLRNFVPVTVSMPDAQTVLLTPQVALQAGKHYTVELFPSLTDSAGNAVFNSIIAASFDTVQGMLASPMMLSGATGRGLAAGDLDGDGRIDLVTVIDDYSDIASFNVFRQNASGSFDAPYRVSLSARAGCANVGVVQLADMNNDGRTDIVSSRGSCGIEIAYQSATGQFDRTELLVTDGALYIRLVDVNGDGRRDVVATNWFGDTVSVWLQQADGSWGQETRVPLFHNGYGDLAVGDLNGDGRPDIAMTSGQGDLHPTLGITYQQADGSFAAPQYQALAGINGTTPLTIADVDGDGRADLLVSVPGGGGVWLFKQQADGNLAAATRIEDFGGGDALRVADLDGDGRADIVVVYGQMIHLLTQAADGSFLAAQSYRGGGIASAQWPLVVADLNGDGRTDLALTGPTILLNRGNASSPAGTAVTAARAVVRRSTGLGQLVRAALHSRSISTTR
jgi:hypothetical protein